MEKTLTEMAAEITTAQAAHSSMTIEEMEAFLKKSFEALQDACLLGFCIPFYIPDK